MKCIDEEIPFEIPEGWEWCRVIEVILPPKYGTSSKSLPLGDVPVLRMGNIQNGEIAYDKLVFSDNKSDNEKYDLQKGDLLFNRTNSAELVGKTAIYRGEHKSIYAGYLILLRPLFINSDFLNYIFSTPYVRSYCKEVKTIGVQQCNINAEKISDLLIPIAPKEEQMRIVSKIKEVLPKVDIYSKSQDKLNVLNYAIADQIKKSVLQEAIQGKLAPQITEEGTAQELLEQIKQEKLRLVKEGKLKKSALTDSVIFRGDDNKYYERIGTKEYDISEEIPFDIPYSWCWCRLSNVISLLSGRDLVPELYNSNHNGIPYITGASNFNDGSLIVNRWTNSPLTISHKNDLLITCKGTIGELAFNQIGDIHIARQIMSLSGIIVELDYIQCYLKAIVPALEKQANSMIPGISRDTLLNAILPLPPKGEQKRIISRVTQLLDILK